MKRSAIKPLITRRKLMTAGAAAIAAPLLSGCEQISDAPQFRFFLEFGRLASLRGQRLLLARQPLAREYAMADISPDFPPNGTAMPPSPQYRQMMMRGFEDWHLAVDGLVRTPQTYSPSTAALGARCEEGQRDRHVDMAGAAVLAERDFGDAVDGTGFDLRQPLPSTCKQRSATSCPHRRDFERSFGKRSQQLGFRLVQTDPGRPVLGPDDHDLPIVVRSDVRSRSRRQHRECRRMVALRLPP
jgi:hypothetical protein